LHCRDHLKSRQRDGIKLFSRHLDCLGLGVDRFLTRSKRKIVGKCEVKFWILHTHVQRSQPLHSIPSGNKYMPPHSKTRRYPIHLPESPQRFHSYNEIQLIRARKIPNGDLKNRLTCSLPGKLHCWGSLSWSDEAIVLDFERTRLMVHCYKSL